MIIERYKAPVKDLWQGRKDGPESSRFHEVIHCIDLQKEQIVTDALLSFAFVGFACDAGIIRNQGRPGAALGPSEFRKVIAKMPIPINKSCTFWDVGDIICSDGNLEASQQVLAQVVADLLNQGVHPIVIGGGHEVAWGHYQGITKAYPNLDCAIVNIDAHLDLRPLIEGNMGSSGTSFMQIAEDRLSKNLKFDYTCIGLQTQATTQSLLQQAKKLNVRIISAEEIHRNGIENTLKVLDQVINSHEAIYLTICLDVFAAPFAPGVSAPQPLGLLPWHVIPIIKYLAASGKLISLDIAELSPPLDQNNITTTLAASLVSASLNSFP